MAHRHASLRRHLLRWAPSMLAVVTAAAAAATFELPPIVQPATHEHHPGKVVWCDLVTPDLEGAKRFYGGLLGWTFNDLRAGSIDYSVALSGGEPVAGIVQRTMRPGARRRPGWLTFIAVRSVGDAEQAVRTHGGKLLSPPHDYPQRGWQATFEDPQGAVFAVLQSSQGDPPDTLAPPSEWIWSALVTRDAGTSAAFYQTVFGYEVFELPDESSDHLVLSTDQFARASVNAFPSGNTQAHPHWLDFVRVDSVTSAAERAQALGGRVLVAPHRGRSGNQVAVLADPAGAPFGIMEWTGSEAQEAK